MVDVPTLRSIPSTSNPNTTMIARATLATAGALRAVEEAVLEDTDVGLVAEVGLWEVDIAAPTASENVPVLGSLLPSPE